MKSEIEADFVSAFFIFIYNNFAMFENPLTQKIADFLIEIGLEVQTAKLDEKTFLPGILIKNGKILVDEERLLYPGDLLHEAGHLAIAPKNLRNSLSGEIELSEFNLYEIESGADAWSYAALLYLGLDPHVVFHSDGYQGKSESLLFGFSLGVYPGANVIVKAGLAAVGEDAIRLGVPSYPQMLKWLRD